MKQFILYIVFILSASAFTSCEKVIDLDVPAGDQIPYIDAWITDKPGVQQIKFQRAVGYLDNSTPPVISDAQISVTDLTLNQTYDFTYNNGAYTHDPGAGNSIGVIGHEYKLTINWKGETYEAKDKLNRVPPIDSITVEFKEEKGGEKEGYYAKFYAVDLKGAMDYYWIRTYRNGVLNQNVNEMWSVDGAYYEDANSDGFNFIIPIREGITSGEKPYEKNDEVKVVLRGISKDAYGFIRMLTDQLANGGLFAKVLANVPTNVAKQKTDSEKIVGWFGTISETEMSKKIE
ncbi:DUF4249 family protein [Pseudobacter ginsenosidimutans]|uniref:Uncharacterized protein DUF4249 n=1 Tax=Pseudobacter ginsenosidimutans TaxID=661488 RepID=A0A4Q7MSX0_9BACT|nr:DUF4249 family protein [Pseudobacter ginsenosidimutans]QEC41321.1 DUF4249 domain-containing protein [Pseudobacter ginsenosidimutans]RZS71905.1 uncharacterized protein DUF4249 [Pseudobacter ginsenosidimutans]